MLPTQYHKVIHIETTTQAAALIREMLPKVQQEERVFVLPLDASGRVLAWPVMVSLGHKDGTTMVDPKEVFKAAFKAGADAIIVAHNHPSGNLMPSRADLQLTEELRSRAEWLGLEFIDHIILGTSKTATDLDFTSLAELGKLAG